jgi:hypothetical protein
VRCALRSGDDAGAILSARAAQLAAGLVEEELSAYLERIQAGKNVVGLPYAETTQAQRALRFLQWAKDNAVRGNHQALRFAHLLIDQFSIAQIDALLGAGRGVKVKAWAEKIRAMATSMEESKTAAETI